MFSLIVNRNKLCTVVRMRGTKLWIERGLSEDFVYIYLDRKIAHPQLQILYRALTLVSEFPSFRKKLSVFVPGFNGGGTK
jgi:hypothetical protein